MSSPLATRIRAIMTNRKFLLLRKDWSCIKWQLLNHKKQKLQQN
uniref:Uncharacterized protein n=1 Tax=Rhizophora mucronata TaxID=61149 RepID=A0A2P2NVE2_RHIMU